MLMLLIQRPHFENDGPLLTATLNEMPQAHPKVTSLLCVKDGGSETWSSVPVSHPTNKETKGASRETVLSFSEKLPVPCQALGGSM